MELFHAADGYLAAVRTRYMRAAGAEKIRKIGYLRLARSIEYNRFAIGGRRGDKYIFGRAHARERESYFFSMETVGASAREHAALGLDLCAHKAQGGQVKVNRTQSYLAAAGRGYLRHAEPCEQGRQKYNGRAHLAHELARHVASADICRIYCNGVALAFDFAADKAQNFYRGVNIGKARAVMNNAHAVNARRSRQDRQRAVFCALEAHLARESVFPCDPHRFHFRTPRNSISNCVPSYAKMICSVTRPPCTGSRICVLPRR